MERIILTDRQKKEMPLWQARRHLANHRPDWKSDRVYPVKSKSMASLEVPLLEVQVELGAFSEHLNFLSVGSLNKPFGLVARRVVF